MLEVCCNDTSVNADNPLQQKVLGRRMIKISLSLLLSVHMENSSLHYTKPVTYCQLFDKN